MRCFLFLHRLLASVVYCRPRILVAFSCSLGSGVVEVVDLIPQVGLDVRGHMVGAPDVGSPPEQQKIVRAKAIVAGRHGAILSSSSRNQGVSIILIPTRL